MSRERSGARASGGAAAARRARGGGRQPVELAQADGAVGGVAAPRELLLARAGPRRSGPAGARPPAHGRGRRLACHGVGSPRHHLRYRSPPVGSRECGRADRCWRTGSSRTARSSRSACRASPISRCSTGSTITATRSGSSTAVTRALPPTPPTPTASSPARPGICLVTRGPGARHASVGVHTAHQDSTPLMLLVGQIARGTRDRESFQEVDYRAVFGPIAKWAFEIETPSRIPRCRARVSGCDCRRPGPVVLALPEDVLAGRSMCADAPRLRDRTAGADAEAIAAAAASC